MIVGFFLFLFCFSLSCSHPPSSLLRPCSFPLFSSPPLPPPSPLPPGHSRDVTPRPATSAPDPSPVDGPTEIKCDNKHVLQRNKKSFPSGTFLSSFSGNLSFENTDRGRACLLPHGHCVTNKTKEVYLKIVHKICYDVRISCTFCRQIIETNQPFFFTMKYPQNYRETLNLPLF